LQEGVRAGDRHLPWNCSACPSDRTFTGRTAAEAHYVAVHLKTRETVERARFFCKGCGTFACQQWGKFGKHVESKSDDKDHRGMAIEELRGKGRDVIVE